MTIGTAWFRQAVHGCAGWASARGHRRERILVRYAGWYAGAVLRMAGALLAAGALACAPSSTDPGKLPPTVADPTTVQNEAGALAFYRQVVMMLAVPFDRFVTETGVFTDELAGLPGRRGLRGNYTSLDSRQTAVFTSGTFEAYPDFYTKFHRVRAQAREARGFLATYALSPDQTDAYDVRDLRAHLYALEGYAEIFLADFYCSGIPLSTVDFQGDYTLTPGFATKDVYLHAAGLFDSALALVHDSANVGALAAVGKGRALLGAGNVAEAAAAVTAVSDGYQYQVTDNGSDPDFSIPTGNALQVFAGNYANIGFGNTDDPNINTPGMGDSEGYNGLPYVSSHDPRTPVTELGPGPFGGTMYFPTNYPREGSVTLTLASAVEARLIQAEAELRADPNGSAWLQRLNALRQTVGLADTTDPGAGVSEPLATKSRVDLLFRERAFWLYLTGHRQGDLRRLLRQYPQFGYSPATVYPSGPYPGGANLYGDVIVAPVPTIERERNPKYTGCIHLQA